MGSLWQRLKKRNVAAPDFEGELCCPLCKQQVAIAAWKHLRDGMRRWQLTLMLEDPEKVARIRAAAKAKHQRESKLP